MTRMTGPDCAVVCNLINSNTHTHTHTHTLQGGCVQFNKYTNTPQREREKERDIGRLGWKEKKRGQDRVRSVAADPENLENSKEAGREAQGTQGLSKNSTSREGVSPLSRLIRGFPNKYH